MNNFKKMIFIGIILVSCFGVSKTQIFVNDDYAKIIIQGSDSDALRLFDSINQVPVTEGNFLKKEITYFVVGDAAFKLSCRLSKLTNSGSCTLFMTSMVASLDKISKSVLLGINDQFDAPRLSKNFHDDGDQFRPLIFQSDDSKLQIWKTKNSMGDVVSFTLTYK